MVTTAPRRRLAPEQRRRELLGALATELAGADWHRLTVAMVVRRADASQGLFYRYFHDLDEAFIALLEDRILPPLLAASDQLDLDHTEGTEVEASLTRWFENLATLVAQEGPVLRAALLAAPSGHGPAAQYCRDLIEQLRAWGEGLLQPLNGQHPYRDVNARHVSHMVVGMTIHCALTGLDGAEPATWAREMARFEAWGLLGAPEQTTPRPLRPKEPI